MSEHKLELKVSVGASNIVHVTIGGNINAGEMSKFAQWISKVKDTIRKEYEREKEQVLCLVDITNLKEYHPQVLVDLASMMKDNEPYVLRTATYGGNSYMTMAEDIVIALSGRKNLRAFNTRDEALRWLQDGGDEREINVEM
jgi:hypothetical protein